MPIAVLALPVVIVGGVIGWVLAIGRRVARLRSS
jgi:hypothetical protein